MTTVSRAVIFLFFLFINLISESETRVHKEAIPYLATILTVAKAAGSLTVGRPATAITDTGAVVPGLRSIERPAVLGHYRRGPPDRHTYLCPRLYGWGQFLGMGTILRATVTYSSCVAHN